MGSDRARPPRLFILRPTLGQGGADRVTLTLLRRLDRERFAPTLVLMRAEGELLAELPADVPLRSLEARSLWSAWRPLTALLRREAPDILFSTSGGANVAACLAHRLARSRARLVLSERNVLVRDQPRLKRRAMLVAKRRLYPAADAVTTVSRGVRDDLIARLDLAPERVRVVYNPVVTTELGRLAEDRPVHPWLSAPEPLVLAAGRLVGAKGFDTLLEAFARLRRRQRARLLVLGEGPERPALEARIQTLGLEQEVDLPGFVANPFAYMARCTVFVLSSRFEGLPGALIQAMACGAAVVSTDCPAGPAEIVTSGESGLLVPVGDSAALAQAIERLLTDSDLRRRLATRGRREAWRRFQADRVLDRYTAALLGGSAR